GLPLAHRLRRILLRQGSGRRGGGRGPAGARSGIPRLQRPSGEGGRGQALRTCRWPLHGERLAVVSSGLGRYTAPVRLRLGEILIIFVVLMLFFGVDKLPRLGDALGKGIRNFRKAAGGEPDAPSDGAQESLPEGRPPAMRDPAAERDRT